MCVTWFMSWRVDMFPHLLHTKQFLDWRFGRLDGEDTESTGAASGCVTGRGRGRGRGGRVAGSERSLARRRPCRLRADSRRLRPAHTPASSATGLKTSPTHVKSSTSLKSRRRRSTSQRRSRSQRPSDQE